MKILLVDDEKMTLKAIQHELEGDYEVVTCEDGKAALAAIGRENPDMVISDIMMPFVSGLQLLDHLKKSNRNIPVILVSALDEIEVIQLAIDLGADDFIMKPLNMTELRIRVRRVVKKHSGKTQAA